MTGPLIDAAKRLSQPVTIWLTGFSGSGKSTLAYALAQHFELAGQRVFILDGDIVRRGLCRDLGFSQEARRENIRRVAEVAKLFNQAGMIVIAALISPLRNDRERAREIIGCNNFYEIWLSTALDVCEARDVKGLYRKARQGLISEFTGVSAPYEAPDNPHLALDTAVHDLQQCVEQVHHLLRYEINPQA